MASTVAALIERVMGELHQIVQTRTVVGEPVQAGPVTLIPVSKITLGFGAGGGQEGKGQSGTGGGASVEPIGFVVVDADGKVQMLTMREKEVSWGQLVELVPDAVSKIKGFVDRRKDTEEEEAGEDRSDED
ncbi:MAG: spore germination protein GerW family protein [Candidatus Latescibacterota bacterium]|uniref:Sporulation protein YtfJ n=1 Tax=marine metagenome TaxID=408172 RepID=A0A382SUA1_9ZZZZ|nr:spore germination protein GerW family protein [Candidatus Latescibacterota bacterium]